MNKTTEQGNQGKDAFRARLITHLGQTEIKEVARIMECADDGDDTLTYTVGGETKVTGTATAARYAYDKGWLVEDSTGKRYNACYNAQGKLELRPSVLTM